MMVGLKSSNSYCLGNFDTKIVQIFRNSKVVKNSPRELTVQNKTRSRPVPDAMEIWGVFERGETWRSRNSEVPVLADTGRYSNFYLCSLAFAVFSVQISAGAAIAKS